MDGPLILFRYCNSNYTHEKYIYDPNRNFGFGNHSTSPKERVWQKLQSYIKHIYHIILDNNFFLFLRESELRFIFRNKNALEIEKEKKDIMLYLFNIVEFELYLLDELEENNNYDY